MKIPYTENKLASLLREKLLFVPHVSIRCMTDFTVII